MLKYIIGIICCLLGISTLLAQNLDANQNYVRSTTARIPISSKVSFETLKTSGTKEEKMEGIQYFDGLGRPIQTIGWKDSPTGEDMISFQKYDAFGRESEIFLPYTGSKNGGFTDAALAEIEQAAFYNQTGSNLPVSPFPKSITQFEAAPTARILEQGGPGAVWQPEPQSVGSQSVGEHTIVQAFHVNTTPVKALKCLLNNQNTPVDYPVGSLNISSTIDENGNVTKIYADNMGRQLLRQTQVTPGGTDYATTAFGYDLFGRLQYVIQPEGWKLIENGTSINLDGFVLSYAFQYFYDKKGRVIRKQIPGKAATRYIYNDRDQLVLSQEGLHADRGEWIFFKYDRLGRPILTGKYHPTTMQSVFETQIHTMPLYEQKQSGNMAADRTGEVYAGYSNQAFPIVGPEVEVLSVTYYDDYDFDQDGTVGSGQERQVPATATPRVRGMITGMQVKVINPDPDMPKWIWTLTYYDHWGREVKTFSTNHLHSDGNGNPTHADHTSHTYNFVGENTKVETRHFTLDQSDQWTINTFTLDHRGRLLNENEQLKINGVFVGKDQLAHNEYNELGQLVEEKLGARDNSGNDPLQDVDYRYNIKGWLTHINGEGNYCALGADDVPPATPTNLSVHINAGTEQSLWPRFAVTGDDGMLNGRNAYFEMAIGIDQTLKQKSIDGIQDTDFWTIKVPMGGGYAPGTMPLWNIPSYTTADDNRLLYFAVRVFDESGNASPFSNVVQLQAGQAGTSTQVPGLDAEPFNYFVPICEDCEFNKGTALQLNLNSLDITFELVEVNGTIKLQYTVQDQKDLQYYRPAVSGMYAEDQSHTLVRKIDLESSSLNNATGFPATYTLSLPNSQNFSLIFDYKDFYNQDQSPVFSTLDQALQQTITQHLVSHGISSSDAQNCYDHLETRYLNNIRDVMDNRANGDLFEMHLLYEEGFAEISTSASPQFNGNISGMAWRGPTECTMKGYGYQYDAMNRLVDAYYEEYDEGTNDWRQNTGAYNASFGYDLNGNITQLTREGYLGNGTYGTVDDLAYFYYGNNMTKVTDALGSTVDANIDFFRGFADPLIAGNYGYDLSGNLASDPNRQMVITYNHLNKPEKVQKGGDEYIQYIYSADGIKLRQKVIDPGSPGGYTESGEPIGGGATPDVLLKITDYVHAWQYEDTDGEGTVAKALVHISNSKGRTVPVGNDWIKEFYLKDHLGNTRVVFADYDADSRVHPDPSSGPDIRQLNEGYYPFGLEHNTAQHFVNIPENQYLYNGKEQQDELDWGVYDYGARMYDPVLGRWHGVDALADLQHSYSPFHYVLNNPLKLIDPDGLIWEDPQEGEYLQRKVKNRIDQLARRKNRLEKIREKRIKKGKSTTNQEKAIDIIERRTEQLKITQDDIEAIRDDQDHVYRLAEGTNLGYGRHGVWKDDYEVINIFGSKDELHIHEIRHVALSLKSEKGLEFTSNDNLLKPTTPIGWKDEIEGYKAQFGYSGTGPGAAGTDREILDRIANYPDDFGNFIYPTIRSYYLFRLKMEKKIESKDKGN
ncbi:MAG: DUF6443 domain-containing protein [Bacteroidota bacterium]